MTDYNAFTWTAPEIRTQIVIPVEISESSSACEEFSKEQRLVSVRALWDTGAGISAVTEDFAEKMNLTSIGVMDVDTADGIRSAKVYSVDIKLQDIPLIMDMHSVEVTDSDDFDAIIGMDIMSLGDLAITTGTGKTMLSFRIPADKKPIDFVKNLPSSA
jgi:hypothetical protein